MSSRAEWVINAPNAVSEVIDGELVVINLEKGRYYSSEGIGSYLWQCVEQLGNGGHRVARCPDRR
jgi:photosystem II stability/assembly factor-like uncharacterized protein